MAKAGRKSKKSTIDLKTLVMLCEKGLTDKELAKVFGVSTVTLNSYKKDEQFLNTIKKGKDFADHEVEASLFKKACGFVREINRSAYNPKTDKLTEWVEELYHAPDTTACIFWLKNRQPKKWRDKQQIDFGDKVKKIEVEYVN